MTLDEITSALRSSDTTPTAALGAGVAKTDELAPLVFDIADKLCSGVYLLPEENDLLFYGLHILAAARHPKLFDRVVMIAQRSEEELNSFFPITFRPACAGYYSAFGIMTPKRCAN